VIEAGLVVVMVPALPRAMALAWVLAGMAGWAMEFTVSGAA
jgi:hypothetical protein